jgi:DNA-binding XRE family transcriptional regulator
MKAAKKKKLESKGWKVGSAYDLLGLTEEEARLIELKLDVSESLRKLRNKKHITQQELAARLHSSQSRIAKMEAGDPSVSLDLMAKAYFKLGATSKEVGKALSGRAHRPLRLAAEKRASYGTSRRVAKAKK